MEDYIDLSGDGGVLKKIVKEGNGVSPKLGSTVFLYYAGRLEDGTEFDKTDDDPFYFKLGGGEVIEGWDICVASMTIGEECECFLNSKYAYGSSGAGDVIKPNSNLIFKMNLLKSK